MNAVLTSARNKIVEDLYPHQITAYQKLESGKILCGGVGSGKTKTAIAYYLNSEHAYKNLYVITTAKKRDALDWQKEAAQYAISGEEPYSSAGILTVDSWNNISKYVDVQNAFFIFDEQRLVGSGSWVKSFLKIAKKNDWILLSATPGDSWLDYIPVFIANGFYKNKTEFIREHVVYNSYSNFPKVDRYLGTGKLLRHRDELLINMPYASHMEPIIIKQIVGFDAALYDRVWKSRWNPYTDEPIKSVSELFYTIRKVVNSDESRIAALRDLILTRYPKMVVFYNFDYELDILRTLTDVTTVAEWNGHRHDDIPDTDYWVYLVQYNAGSEGWNCTETNAMCFYSLNYSYKMFKQAQGRIDRLDSNHDKLWYFVFISNADIDRAINRALSHKRSFNESGYFRNFKET